MGLSSVLPVLGAAAAAVAGRTAVTLGQGLSFAEHLVTAGPPPIAAPLATPSATRQSSAKLLDELQALLEPRLAAAGIDASQSIALRQDARGGVDEIGGHPDRAYIEELFLDDPELSSKFNQLTNQLREERQQQQALNSDRRLPAEPTIVVDGRQLRIQWE